MSQTSLKIYQIYYDKRQRLALDSSFTPFFNSSSKGIVTETDAMKCISSQIGNSYESLWGTVSWKFNSKTRISGMQFKNFIMLESGYDFYYINPFIADLYYLNPWLQGDQWHPGLLELSQAFFKVVDPTYNPKIADHDFTNTTYCNYFAGNYRFWATYFSYLHELETFLNTPDARSLGASIEPTRSMQLSVFMRERLVSYLMFKGLFKSKGFVFQNSREGLTQKQLMDVQKQYPYSLRVKLLNSPQQNYSRRLFNSRILNTIPGITIDNFFVRKFE